MLKLKKKTTDRILLIAANGAHKNSVTVFNLLLSFLVVNRFSKVLWGEFTLASIVATLLVTFISWGSQEYLLKKFAQDPSKVPELWLSNVLVRTILFLPAILIIIVLPLPQIMKILVGIYVAILVLYKSFDVLILFNRRFMFGFILEGGGFVLAVIFLLIRASLTIEELLVVVIAITLVKIIPLLFAFPIRAVKVDLNFAAISNAFPFFLPSLIGLVQSRIDMYVVAIYLDKAHLATYQILISMLSIVHQFSLMALSPFIKNFYRLRNENLNRIATKFFSYGVLVTLLAVPCIALALKFYYSINLTSTEFLLAGLVMLPLFYYSVQTYSWFKNGRQYGVALVNLAMALVTLMLSITLVPEWHITGALVASAVSQWIGFAIFALKNP